MNRARQSGFTLVEAIMVMVITGILAGMVAVFIRLPVQSYVDTAARAELTDVADLALRRISRELRLALPNSIIMSSNGNARTMQFLITKTGGRYVDISDENTASLLPLNWNAASTQFDLVGTAPAGNQQIVSGDRIVVFNLGDGMNPANAYSGQNVAQVTAVSGTRITLASNPFASQNPQMGSPDFRFQVVSGTVIYVCDTANGTLSRYHTTLIPSSSTTPSIPATTPALLANLVSDCSFDYTQVHNNIALITLRLTLTQTNGESIRLVRQIHVDNTP